MRTAKWPTTLRPRRRAAKLFLVTGVVTAIASFPLILALCGDPVREARVADVAGVLFLLSGGLVGGGVLTRRGH